ncbi:hypothetical protein [Paenibacillus sp. FSL R5-0470]|uniref:hypothetical protein n=1 Tax=Paenibacillus sp. FSL R5-0470 TaxID=2921641 RepID=UPI0030DA1FFD
MKKFSSILLSFLFIFTIFTSSASAATTGSVTSTRADNSAKSIQITGSGKYMKLTVTYSGSLGPDGNYGGDAILYKVIGTNQVQTIANIDVTPNNRTQSTDVWLDLNATYILQVDVNILAASNASVTGSIR